MNFDTEKFIYEIEKPSTVMKLKAYGDYERSFTTSLLKQKVNPMFCLVTRLNMRQFFTIEAGLSILLCYYHCMLLRISAYNLDDFSSIRRPSTSGINWPTKDASIRNQGDKLGANSPALAAIPRTSFTCSNLETGYYADLETRCQVFHICEDGKKISFLCPNGTVFRQSDLICDWWFKVNCTESPLLYDESSEQLKEDTLRRKLARRTPLKKNILSRVPSKKKVVTRKNSQLERRNFEIDDVGHSTPNSYTASNDRSEVKTIAQRRPHSPPLRKKRPLSDKSSQPELNVRGLYDINENRKNRFWSSNDKNNVKHDTSPIQKNKPHISNVDETTSRNLNPSNIISSTKTNELRNMNLAPDIIFKIEPQKKSQMEQRNFVNIFVSSKHKVLRPNKFNEDNKKKYTCELCTSNGTVKTNYKSVLNISDGKSSDDETQITQQSSTNFHRGSKPNIDKMTHSNHRTSYKAIKEPEYYNNRYSSRIVPVTSHYITTQSFNTGKTFIGSRVGKMIPKNERKNGVITLSLNKVKRIGSFTTGVSDTTPLSIGEMYSTSPMPWNVINTSVANKIQSNLNSDTPNLYSEISNEKFNELAEKVEQYPVVETKYVKPNNINMVSMQNDSSTYYSIHTSNGSSKSYYMDSPPTRAIFSPKSPSPFVLSSTKSTKIENENKNSHDVPLTHSFFRISTASPFTVSQRNSQDYSEYNQSSSPEANFNNYGDEAKTTFRSGLVVPPSVSPQVIHSLAAYFENSVNNFVMKKKKDEMKPSNGPFNTASENNLKSLFSNITREGYRKLFMNNDFMENIKRMTSSTKIMSIQNETTNQENSSDVRKLAKIFSHALSEYLDDPPKFKKALLSVRPTEPPNPENILQAESELLNFSEDDSKSILSPVFNASERHSILSDKKIEDTNEVKNTLSSDSESLSGADTQSFISQFNNLSDADKKNTFETKSLPNDHWTSSFEATNLLRTTFAVDPHTLNKNFQGTESYVALNSSNESGVTYKTNLVNGPIPPSSDEKIKYELRVLPKLLFNSTQLDGISIDFMNNNHLTESKFRRILKKLNLTENEFMNKMKSLEKNPLTRRLVLLLIKQCDLDISKAHSKSSTVHPSGSFSSVSQLNTQNENTRALQLLNSLYNIATKFGR